MLETFSVICLPHTFPVFSLIKPDKQLHSSNSMWMFCDATQHLPIKQLRRLPDRRRIESRSKRCSALSFHLLSDSRSEQREETELGDKSNIVHSLAAELNSKRFERMRGVFQTQHAQFRIVCDLATVRWRCCKKERVTYLSFCYSLFFIHFIICY